MYDFRRQIIPVRARPFDEFVMSNPSEVVDIDVNTSIASSTSRRQTVYGSVSLCPQEPYGYQSQFYQQLELIDNLDKIAQIKKTIES